MMPHKQHNKTNTLFCDTQNRLSLDLGQSVSNYFQDYIKSRSELKIISTTVCNIYLSRVCSMVFPSPKSSTKFMLCSLEALYIRKRFYERIVSSDTRY